jgi:hypothetical protein
MTRKDNPVASKQHETHRWQPTGHPTVEELMAAQGTSPITDITALHGDFWPEDEPIEEFLETLHEWRGHRRASPAA